MVAECSHSSQGKQSLIAVVSRTFRLWFACRETLGCPVPAAGMAGGPHADTLAISGELGAMPDERLSCVAQASTMFYSMVSIYIHVLDVSLHMLHKLLSWLSDVSWDLGSVLGLNLADESGSGLFCMSGHCHA